MRLDRPGFYTVRAPGRKTLLAVDVDPQESDLRPAAADRLARWSARGLAVERPRPAVEPSAAPAERPLGPWLLALAAALLLVESLAANVDRLALRLPWRGVAAP